jgi:hypothetical protein
MVALRRIAILVVAAVLTLDAGAQPTKRTAIPRTEWVELRYFDAKSAAYAPVQDQVKRQQLLEAFGALIEEKVKRAPPLRIATEECGQENAFYVAKTRAIVICYELIRSQMNVVAAKLKGAPQEVITSATVGSLAFVMFHELGHALLSTSSASFVGREEDLADQFATYIILESAPQQGAGMIFGAILTYETGQLFYLRRHYAKEHSLDPQRKFNLACWGYGHSPAAFEPILRYVKMPPERASRCANEYAQIKRGLRSAFAVALK